MRSPVALEHYSSRLSELVSRQTRSHMFTELDDIGEIPIGCAARRGDHQPAVRLHQVDGKVAVGGVVETDDDLSLSDTPSAAA